MSWKQKILLVVALIATFLIGRATSGGSTTDAAGADPAATTEGPAEPEIWTCPMHPEIESPEFGACPKCGMDLVIREDDGATGPRQLAMSEASVALAGIRTEPVRREFLTRSVRMVGKVAFDETRVRTIAARFGGRLDRLYVDYTGVSVRPGDHLVQLYSPELLTAQQELLGARARLDQLSSESSEFLRSSTRRGYEAARRKLELWGLSEEQVDQLLERGEAEDRILIRSPIGGVVVHKAKLEGEYVGEGTPVYRIADLSHLWVLLDAYEQDLPWLRYGQTVSLTTEAMPGRVFEGRISFVSPTVDERTRTVRVRVNVENPDGELKPGMFARASVRARIGAEGQVLEPQMQGKWISPMHPEIVKDGPGQCEVCGMDLVPAESFLPERAIASGQKPIVVPRSAVLVTGRRAVVYVRVPNTERPTFEGREIVLGPRADDHHIVLAGLKEGELVVVNGAFRVDSSMQIQAKPSMMSMPGEVDFASGPGAELFRLSLEPLYAAYFEMQEALAGDDDVTARGALERFATALGAVDTAALSQEGQARFAEERSLLTAAITPVRDTSGIDGTRKGFEALSAGILAIERAFHHPGEGLHYEAFCPMAFDDKGASWLQTSDQILNPYFGASMLACGEIRKTFVGRGAGPKLQTGPKAESGSKPEQAVEPPPEQPVEQPPEQPVAPASTELVQGLEPVLERYLDLQTALAADDFPGSKRAVTALATALQDAKADTDAESGQKIDEALEAMRGAAAPATGNIEALRARFETLSNSLLDIGELTTLATDEKLFLMYCPMAFDDKGALWLQRKSLLANPYFGSRMLRCGTTEKELPAKGEGR